MIVDKNITVNLTIEKIRDIIVEYLESRDIECKSVVFNVSDVSDSGDRFSHYQLVGATCQGKL